jgi:hypothetical protein
MCVHSAQHKHSQVINDVTLDTTMVRRRAMEPAPHSGPPDFFSQPSSNSPAGASPTGGPAIGDVPSGEWGSANPFGSTQAPVPSAEAPAATTAADPLAAPADVAEPIDPELFNGPPVADSYAPAGTGTHGNVDATGV